MKSFVHFISHMTSKKCTNMSVNIDDSDLLKIFLFLLFGKVGSTSYAPETTRYIPIFINKRYSAVLLNLLLYSKPPTNCCCSKVSQSTKIKTFIQKVLSSGIVKK